MFQLFASIAHTEDAPSSSSWPQFRGANAAGVDAKAKPPIEIGPEKAVLWKIEVPWSPSSPIIWGERIILTTFHEGELQTRCYHRKEGNLLWKRGVKPEGIEEFHRKDGSPAASTPATNGKRIVSYFGSMGVICHDMDGKELWRHLMPVALSGGRYGSGTSPIIIGERVILNRDQHQFSALIALDLKTGKPLWETPRPETAGSFGTPVYWRNDGIDEIVIAASGRLKGYDLKTGVERWLVSGITGYVCTTPVIGDGLLHFAAYSNAHPHSPLPKWEDFLKNFDKNSDGHIAFEEIDLEQRDYYRGLDKDRDGKYTEHDWKARNKAVAHMENLMVAVKPGGIGDISASHVVWEHRKGLPYVSSPLFYDGRVYLVKDGGIITSLDAKSGEPFYRRKRIGAGGSYYASPVAADGRIYVASLGGTVSVLKAGGDSLKILHQVDFESRILATPALADDKIYLRTATHLFAFGK